MTKVGVGVAAIAAAVLAGQAAAQDAPFSPVVEANGVLYLAGKLGRDPQANKLPGEIKAETRFALEAIRETLEGAGSSLADVVRCNVFLGDIGDFSAMNEVYRTFFPKDPPARTTFAVTLVAGAKIEIECTAVRGRAENARMESE